MIPWSHCHPPIIQSDLFENTEYSPEPRLTVLSYGAGQDSTAILYMLGHDQAFRRLFAPHELIVIFSDTGAEHTETYEEALPDAKAFCQQHAIPFFHLEPGSPYHSKAWPDLLSAYRRTQTCGSRGFPRTCTDQLKIRPFYRFLEEYLGDRYGVATGRKRGFYNFQKGLRVLIGISAEEDRCSDAQKRPLWMRRNVEIRYPLQEIGWTRLDAQAAIRGLGYRVPVPSACEFCPFMTRATLLLMHRTKRASYNTLLELEQTKKKRFENLGHLNYGVFGATDLPTALSEAEVLYGHMTTEQLETARRRDGHGVRSRY